MTDLLAKLPPWATPHLLLAVGTFLLSFLAILLVGRVARWMRLGVPLRIESVDHAIRLADEAHYGFDGIDAAVDRTRTAAIVRNARGEHIVVRAHGNHCAARHVGPEMTPRLDRNLLILTPNDPFGDVVLDLGERAAVWAALMRKPQHPRVEASVA